MSTDEILNTSRVMMTTEQLLNVEFVKSIKAYPCIWDSSSRKYKNKIFVVAKWDAIAKQFNEPVVVCRERWRNIRTAFLQSLRNESSRKREYYLKYHLQFLMPKIKQSTATPQNSKQSKNGSDLEDKKVYESEDDIKPGAFLEDSHSSDLQESSPVIHCEPESTSFQKTSKPSPDDLTWYCNVSHKSNESQPNKRHKPNDEGDDSDMSFFKSLLRDVRRMNNRQNRKFRFKVMQIVDDILDTEFDGHEHLTMSCGYCNVCKHNKL